MERLRDGEEDRETERTFAQIPEKIMSVCRRVF